MKLPLDFSMTIFPNRNPPAFQVQSPQKLVGFSLIRITAYSPLSVSLTICHYIKFPFTM